jgi:hypothetical protein
LAERVEESGNTFASATGEMGDELPSKPQRHWELLDACHNDLNTRVGRSSEMFLSSITLKATSVVPSNLPARSPSHANYKPLSGLARNLAHRRLAPIKGQ